jgi:hypothetical protein
MAMLLFGDSAVRERITALFARYCAGDHVESDLLPLALRAGALFASESFAWYRQKIEMPDTPAELKKQLLTALGWFRDEETISQILDYTMHSVEPQDRMHVIRSLSSNPAADTSLWPWFRRQFVNIRSMHPYMRSVTIAEVIPVAQVEDEAELDNLLDRFMESADAPVGVIGMAREKRRVFAAMRARN